MRICLQLVKRLLLTANIIVGIVTGAHAQDKFYEQGYIITQEGDTLAGLIERKDEIHLSHSVKFKASPTDSIVVYTPGNIQGFGFVLDDNHFSEVAVDIGRDRHKLPTSRFAKVLARGATTLYRLPLAKQERNEVFLKNNINLYVLEKEGIFLTLGQYEFEYKKRIGVDKKYIGILKAAMSDCLPHEHISDKLEFKDTPIIELVEQYNECKNPEEKTVVFSHIIKPLIRKGLAVSYSQIYSPGRDIISNSQGYSAGYFWDITKPDLSRTLSQRFGVDYLYLTYDYWDRQARKNRVASMHTIRLPLLVQLNINNLPLAKLNPFFNAGLTANLSTDNQISFINIIPYIRVGGGVYIHRFMFMVSVDNLGFSLKGDKILNTGIGIRLDR